MWSKRAGVTFFAVMLVFTAGAALAIDMSCEIVNKAKGAEFSGKMYVSGEMVRMELPQSIVINRIDKGVMYVIMPGAKMYLEQPLDMHNIATVSDKIPGETTRETIGKEVVDGHYTTKYKVTYKANGAKGEVYQWIEDMSGLMIKTSSIDGSWSMEYRNIKKGKQDPRLFEVPAGYKKLFGALQDIGSLQ